MPTAARRRLCGAAGCARRDEIEGAVDRRGRHPGLLRAAGVALHGKADLVEGLEDIEAGLLDGRGQRLGVGAVAVAAVLRDVAGLCRVGNQRAFRRAHLGEAAVGGAQAARAERVVTAGIEDHHVEPGARALHLAQHEVDVHHLEIDVGLARRIGADRNQIIRAGDLNAVAGVIEQRDVGALNLAAEILHGAVHRRLVEIELGAAADQGEAEALSVSAISAASLRGLSSRATFW